MNSLRKRPFRADMSQYEPFRWERHSTCPRFSASGNSLSRFASESGSRATDQTAMNNSSNDITASDFSLAVHHPLPQSSPFWRVDLVDYIEADRDEAIEKMQNTLH